MEKKDESCRNKEHFGHLSLLQFMRIRSDMYLGGHIGDGTHFDDGIYQMIKFVVDLAINNCKTNGEIKIDGGTVMTIGIKVRYYGKGLPHDDLLERCTAEKLEEWSYLTLVNALSSRFEIRSYCSKKVRTLKFFRGILKSDDIQDTSEEDGTYIFFIPDDIIFNVYGDHCDEDILNNMIQNYAYLNMGVSFCLNGKLYRSRNGLLDFLSNTMKSTPLYPIIHMVGKDIEIAFTHTNQDGEVYYSFVNGHYTRYDGTHLEAFKDSFTHMMYQRYKTYDKEILNGIVAAISIKIEDPVYETASPMRLASILMGPKRETIDDYVGNFLENNLVPYLKEHKEDCTNILEKRIKESELEFSIS